MELSCFSMLVWLIEIGFSEYDMTVCRVFMFQYARVVALNWV